jgi:hypothetical protein
MEYYRHGFASVSSFNGIQRLDIQTLRYLSSSFCTARMSEQQLQRVYVKHQTEALNSSLFQRTHHGATTRWRESLNAGGAITFTKHRKLQEAKLEYTRP